MHCLQKLNQDIFACFLQPEYPNNIYLFERRIHKQKKNFLQVTQRLKKYPAEINKVYLLFDNMLDYAQLRHRVSDHTTFDICKQELIAIEQAIERLLSLKHSVQDRAVLLASIDQLETCYQNVLQVSAREPLVFLLFIASLKLFAEAAVWQS